MESGVADAAMVRHVPSSSGRSRALVRWPPSERRPSGDAGHLDYGRSTLFEAHRALHERNIPAFENLTNLDPLPTRGAYVIALPMKIAGGSGGPLRAIALVP